MGDFTCKFPFWVLKRCSFQVKTLFLLILCIKEILGKFGKKLQNDPLELKIAIFVLVSKIMVFHFVYKKDFWHILVKFIVYKVSLLSSRSKKHFRSKKHIKNISSQSTLSSDAYHIPISVCNDFPKYRLLNQQTYQKESQKFRQVTTVCRKLCGIIQMILSMK